MYVEFIFCYFIPGPMYVISSFRGPCMWYPHSGAHVCDILILGPMYVISSFWGPCMWYPHSGAHVCDIPIPGPMYVISPFRGTCICDIPNSNCMCKRRCYLFSYLYRILSLCFVILMHHMKWIIVRSKFMWVIAMPHQTFWFTKRNFQWIIWKCIMC